MRWRTTAAEDGRRWRGYNGADNNDKKQQSTSVQRQRRITTTAGERRGAVVELEDQLFGGRQRLKRRGGQSVAEGRQRC